jgi:thiol-disulfide isomerase/thioredoxin
VKVPKAALAAVAVLAAGPAGFLLSRQFHPRGALNATAGATAIGAGGATGTNGSTVPASGAAPGPQQPPAPTVPELVPALSLPDLAGHPQPLRGTHGRPRLYNFWATWCEPCRREIPLLNTLEARYRADRLQVVGIAVDFRDSVQDYLKHQQIAYPLLVGEEDGVEAARAFGMDMALPFSVFADGQQHVVAVKLGELHAEEVEAILGRMRSVRAGRLDLGQARTAIADDLQALSVKRAKQSTPQDNPKG